MPLTPDHDFSRATVVTEKQNQRVVECVHCFKLLDHHADRLIHGIDHRGMDRHLCCLKLPLVGSQFIPGQRPVHLAGAKFFDGVGKGVGRAEIPFHRSKRGRNDAPLHQSLVAGLLHGIPASLIAGSVFGDQFLRGLKGEMR